MTPSNWLTQWEAAINARDYESGRSLFDPDVTAFGTFAEEMRGIDALIENQWRQMWPFISDFCFHRDGSDVQESADGGLAMISVLWSSNGLKPDGVTFPRRGRATIGLRRDRQGSLKCVHTHFSMMDGRPARYDTSAGPTQSSRCT